MSKSLAPKTSSRKDRLIAWSIHYFTATGALCALYALVEIATSHPRAALLWLMASQVIDGVDGQLARRYKVVEHTPLFDGNVLDLVIDYTTCALVPVLFAMKFDLFPPGLELVISSLIIFVSVIWFARKDIETRDFWFRGFPTAWNLVVTIFWLFLRGSPWVCAGLAAVFIVLTVTPRVKFFHIMRSPQFRTSTILLSSLLLIDMSFMISNRQIRHNILAQSVVLIWSVYSIAICIWRSLQPDEVLPE